jgi:oxygen-independent coproporphyrinogen III oxidase
MCSFEMDLKEVDPAGDYADELALLRPLAAEGMIALKGTEIALKRAGTPFVRIVASVFDQFRREETKGFSVAV